MPATADTPGDLVLPALDLRALARRAAVPAALAAVVVAALVVAGGPLRAFADAFGRAVDADPRWVVAAATFEVLSFVGYVVGQVANTLPVPGAVSGGMVGVLLAFGVDPALALAAVLAYRSVAIWLPASVGLAALNGLRRTTARWSAEDAPAETVAAPERRPAARPLPLRPRSEAVGAAA